MILYLRFIFNHAIHADIFKRAFIILYTDNIIYYDIYKYDN